MSMIEMYQMRHGLPEGVVTVGDFTVCLKAFGIYMNKLVRWCL